MMRASGVLERIPGDRVRWSVLLIGVIVVVAGILLVRGAWSDSMTIDEEFNIHSAACIVNTGLIDLEPTDPAAAKLLASPGVALSGVPTDTTCTAGSYVDSTYQSLFPRQPTLSQLRWLTFCARILPMVVTLALIVICAWWAFQLGGPVAGVLAAALVGFDPTIQAMGHLVSVDMAVSFGFIACLASLWKWKEAHRRRWLVIAGLAMGFALMSKASAVILIPIAIALVVIASGGAPRERLRRAVISSAMVLAVAYVLLTLTYAPFRHSEPAHAWLPNGFNWLVPETWLYGAYGQLVGHVGSAGLYYINGQAGFGGTWSYFPEALVLKSTIGALIAFTVGIAWLCIRRMYEPLVWCALPGLIYFSGAMYGHINIGVRYVTPSIALFWTAAAVGIAALPRVGLVLSAVLGLAAITATCLGPVGSIGYFNAFAVGRHSYYLADSNIDWGQDGYRLRAWWEAAGRPPIQVDLFGGLPASYFIPGATDLGQHPERGDYAIPQPNPNELTVVSVNQGTLWNTWAYQVAHPTCTIGTGLVVIGVSCSGF